MTSEACTNVTTSKLHDTQCGCLLVPGTLTITLTLKLTLHPNPNGVAAATAVACGDVGDAWTNAVGARSFRAESAPIKCGQRAPKARSFFFYAYVCKRGKVTAFEFSCS